MRFTTRLALIVAVVVVAFVGVSYLGLAAVRQSREIADLELQLERLSSDTSHLQSLTFEIRLTSSFATVIPEWRDRAATLEERLSAVMEASVLERLARSDQELATLLARMGSLIDLVRAEIDDYENVLSEFTAGFTDYPELGLARLEERRANFQAARVRTEGDRLAAYLDETMKTMLDRAILHLSGRREATVRVLMWVFLAVVVAASATVVVLILLFTRSLRARFADVGKVMQRLADGDLSVRVDGGSDEIATVSRHMQRSIDAFAGIVTDIQRIVTSAGELRSDLVAASEQSSASVTEIGGNIASITSTIEDLDSTIEQTKAKLDGINEGIRSLEGRIEEQTRSVEESSSAVEQMTASVNNVSRIAADRQEAARTLKSVTDEGHANVEATDEKVSAIAASVDEILGIITVINTIASQTSILSMNAAIEAAHAGEYGHGFAVVAAEIRRLSESTNENAKRIKEQLQTVASLATDTKRSSEVTRASFRSVETEVDSTAAALNEISATMRELAEGTEAVLAATSQAGEITQSIRGEATAAAGRSDDITRDMGHVREISASVRGGIQEIGVGTREINEMVGNLGSVTQEMTEQIDLLGRSVARFRTGDAEAQPSGGSGNEPEGNGSPVRSIHLSSAEESSETTPA